MAEKKSYHHGDLRSALLDAALIELEQSGIERFSLRKVAARAGVSHAAPAHHFKDTQGLLTALATRGFERFVAAMEAREAQAEATPRAQLVAAGLGYVDFAETETALFRLVHASTRPLKDDAALNAAGSAAYMHLVNLMIDACGGSSEDAATHENAAAFWAMAHGIADLATNERLFILEGASQAEREVKLTELLMRAFPKGTSP